MTVRPDHTQLLSVADVAGIVGLSEYTVRDAVRAGELQATKLRGRIRVHPDDLAAWIDQGRTHTIRDLPAVAAPTPRPRGPRLDPREAMRRLNDAA